MTPSPAYLNTYVPRPRPSFPPNIHLETPVESYDLNFVFSPIKVLQGSETDVRLEPFVVRVQRHSSASLIFLYPSFLMLSISSLCLPIDLTLGSNSST